jgi:prepilin-type N-terminal cleavage/methylation domain-containing protein
MIAEGRAPFRSISGPPRGFSLTEVLIALALLGILVAVSVPLMADTVARERLYAAGWETALLLRGLRQRSVAERVGYGLRFVPRGNSWSYSLYRDGNGNGILTADILSGRDPQLRGPDTPENLHEGVRFGLPDSSVPQVPPGTGPIPNPGDPIKFGASDIISFSPTGSISSGTLFLTDGRRVLAVVVYGPTGRIRTARYDPGEGWQTAP